MAADVRIRWHLELVGDPSRNLLRQDRQIRSSLTATDRLQRKLATSATQTGRAQQRGSTMATSALQREGRAAAQTRADVARLNAAQAQAIGAGNRVAASARRVADAYRAQARGARDASAAERIRARASSSLSSHAGIAAGAGATLRSGVAAGGVAAAAGAVGAVKVFAGFEQQMDRVQAVSGATRGEMAQLNKQAQDLGAKTSFSAREAADGMYQLSTAGFKTGEVMRTIPGVLDLAAASGVGLADAAELQASAIRGFGLAAGDAGRVADVLATTVNRSAVEMGDLQESIKYVAPVARATGQDLESMLAALGLMGNVGIKGSQAGTTLRTALVRLTDPTKKAKGALADLHISAGELSGPHGLIPLPKILDKIVRGAQDLDKGARNKALSRIFGREALSGMVALVEKGPKALNANIKALQSSEGQAKRTARTMRDNVAGAWDQFTGSIETAAITLTTRFGPSIKDALKGAAGGVGRITADVGRIPRAIAAGQRGTGEGYTGAAGVAADVSRRVGGDDVSRIAGNVVGVAKTIGTAAMDAGRQLLAAFAPAAPFLQNVLLPLLEGIGKGVLGSVVAAFRVAVPVIRVVSTALGYIGEKAKPLRGVFEGIGTVIGFIFGGPILKGIGLLGKLGGVFRLVGAAARILSVPLQLVGAGAGILVRGVGRIPGVLGKLGGLFTSAGRAAGKLPGIIGSFAGNVVGAAGRLVSAAARGLRAMPAKLAVVASNAGHTVLDKLGSIVGGLSRVAGRAVSAVVKGLGKLGGRVLAIAGSITSGFVELGRRIVQAVVDGIKSAPGAIAGAIKDAAGGISIGGVKIKPLDLLPGRRGGRMHGGGFRRYREGGLVPSLLSPGELVQEGASSWVVPGTPVARDSVLAHLPVGAAVYTADGQARLAAGQSPTQALASQLPHFRRGGRVQAGNYLSTAYGPPWGGINGGGVTATGVNLTRSPHLYGVAVDPSRIALGSNVYAWPNPFGYSGRFRAFDTGGAIKGNRIDFYDWRGRKAQLGWGRRQTRISGSAIRSGGNTYSTGGPGATPSVRILGRSRTRAGLTGDAFSQGIQAGSEGLTRAAIGREGNPILAAIREATRESSSSSSSSKRRRSSSSSSSGGDAGHWTRGTSGAWAHAFAKRWGLRISSGWRSAAHNRAVGGVANSLHTHGTAANPGAIDFVPPKASALAALRRIRPRPREAMIHDVGSGLHLHAGLFRRGGRVQRFRTGGFVGAGAKLNAGATRALSFAGGSLAALDVLLGQAVETRIFALRRSLLTRIRAGGPQRVVQRLQSMLDTVDFELGRRIGRVQDAVSRRTSNSDRIGGALDRLQRRRGLDPSSVGGLNLAAFAGAGQIDNARRNVADLKGALKTARKVGDRAAIRDLKGQLATAQDALDEALVAQIERGRDLATAIAQQALDRAQTNVDTATHRETLANTGLQRLELEQKLAGTYAGGGQARAAFITNNVVPALRAELDALNAQAAELHRQGKTADENAVLEAAAAKTNEILQAQLDAQETIAENTAPRRFGGTLGFSAGGETLTDRLVTAGNGF